MNWKIGYVAGKYALENRLFVGKYELENRLCCWKI